MLPITRTAFNLIKKIKLDGSWRFAPVVPEANGRLKDKVRINGAIEVHSEGTYYIEWRDRGKRCRASVTREDAVDQARRKAIELRAMREGLITSPEPEPEASPKTTIGDAIDAYLRYVRMQRKARTHLTYRYTLDTLLRKSYKKKFVEDASRDDVLDFMTYCYEQGLGARTVYEKVVTVLQLFKQLYGLFPIELLRSLRLVFAAQLRLLVLEPLIELLYLFGRVGWEKMLDGHVRRRYQD